MGKSILLQIINGYLSVTSVVGIYVFVRFLVRNRHLQWLEFISVTLFIGLFTSLLILRGPIFIYRILANMGYVFPEPNWIYVISGVLGEIVFLAIIKVFGPSEWGHRAWIWTFIGATTLVALSLLPVYLRS